MIRIVGRWGAPAFVAHTWPDRVAPLRAVNSTGSTIPPCAVQCSSRGSMVHATTVVHEFGFGWRPGSVTVRANRCFLVGAGRGGDLRDHRWRIELRLALLADAQVLRLGQRVNEHRRPGRGSHNRRANHH